MIVAAQRLRNLAGIAGPAIVLLSLIGTGATTGAALANYSGRHGITAAEHLLTEHAPSVQDTGPTIGGGRRYTEEDILRLVEAKWETIEAVRKARQSAQQTGPSVPDMGRPPPAPAQPSPRPQVPVPPVPPLPAPVALEILPTQISFEPLSAQVLGPVSVDLTSDIVDEQRKLRQTQEEEALLLILSQI